MKADVPANTSSSIAAHVIRASSDAVAARLPYSSTSTLELDRVGSAHPRANSTCRSGSGSGSETRPANSQFPPSPLDRPASVDTLRSRHSHTTNTPLARSLARSLARCCFGDLPNGRRPLRSSSTPVRPAVSRPSTVTHSPSALSSAALQGKASNASISPCDAAPNPESLEGVSLPPLSHFGLRQASNLLRLVPYCCALPRLFSDTPLARACAVSSNLEPFSSNPLVTAVFIYPAVLPVRRHRDPPNSLFVFPHHHPPARPTPSSMMSTLPRMLLAFSTLLLATLATLASAQSSSSSSLFSDQYCNSNLCLRVIYSPSEKVMNMSMSANGGGAPIGWYSVGTGKQMKGSNMMIGWVDTNGKVVMSQRTASGHDDPTTTITAAAATMDSKQSFSNSSGTVWAWSFPLSGSGSTPGASTSFIWASNKSNNPASSTSAHLKQHSDYGSFSLDLTKPYQPASASSSSSGSTGSSAPLTPATAAGSQTGSSRVMNMSNKLIIAHMIMMILAWFILVPAGILIGRYGRTLFTWFPVHRGIQIAAFVIVLIAFVLIVVEVGRDGGDHFSSNHARAGLAILIIMVLQMVLGAVGHKTKRFNVSRIVHVVIGLGVTVAAIWNSTEGLSLWQWAPPKWASWILWIWAAVLAVAYLAGLALLPRDLRQWRQTQAASNEKHEYLGLEQNTSPGYNTPGESLQQHSPAPAPAHPGWGAPPLHAGAHQGYESYAQPPNSHVPNRF